MDIAVIMELEKNFQYVAWSIGYGSMKPKKWVDYCHRNERDDVAPMNQSYQIISLKDFLTIIFKHQKKIQIIFFSIVLLVTLVNLWLPPTYVANSSIMVKFGREYLYNPEVGENKSVNSIQSIGQTEIINSEIEIIKSRDLIGKNIQSLGFENLYPDLVKNPPSGLSPLDAAKLKFEKNLSVESIRKSNVIKIYFGHQDPIIAAKAVNNLVDLLREKHLQVFNNPKSLFLKNQLENYQKQLIESEAELEAYKQKYQVYSHDEQRSLLLQQRNNLDTFLKSTRNDILEMEQKIASLKIQIKSISKNVPLYKETGAVRYNIVDDTKSKLLALQLREKELLSKYEIGSHFPESVRMVENVRNEIKIVKEYLKEQEENNKEKVTTGKNVIYQEIEIEFIKAKAALSSMKSKSANILKQIQQLDKDIKSLDLRERELKKIKRNLVTSESNYETYLKKYEEARIFEDMDQQKLANFSVIQEATIPAKPLKPKKAVNIFLGIVFGFLFALTVAFISEYMGQGLSSAEKVESRLGLPIIATLSYKEGGETFSSSKLLGIPPSLKWGVVSTVLLIALAGIFWSSSNKSWELAEAKNNEFASVSDKTNRALKNAFKAAALEIQSKVPQGKDSPSSEGEKNEDQGDSLPLSSSGQVPIIPHKKIPQKLVKKEDSGVAGSSSLSKKAAPEKSSAHPWAINLFSLPSKEEAVKVQSKLKNSGHKAYITEFQQKSKTWYRVRVGFFSTHQEAKRIGKKLSKNSYIKNFWIVKPTKDEKIIHS